MTIHPSSLGPSKYYIYKIHEINIKTEKNNLWYVQTNVTNGVQ